MDRAKLFKNGKSQAVRLPRKYQLEGSEVYVKRLGRSVILLPKDNPWDMMVDSLEHFSDDFMDERLQPKMEHREPL